MGFNLLEGVNMGYGTANSTPSMIPKPNTGVQIVPPKTANQNVQVIEPFKGVNQKVTIMPPKTVAKPTTTVNVPAAKKPALVNVTSPKVNGGAVGQSDINAIKANWANSAIKTPTITEPAVNNNQGNAGVSSGSTTPTNVYQDKLNALYDKIMGSLSPTEQENELQKQLSQEAESARMGIQNIQDQTIPMDFITGQSQSVENRSLNRQKTLSEQLANLKAQRDANLQGAGTLAGIAGTQIENQQKSIENQQKSADFANQLAMSGYKPYTGVQESQVQFKQGLLPAQRQGIMSLLNKPQETWSEADKANWKYATGGQNTSGLLPSNLTTLTNPYTGQTQKYSFTGATTADTPEGKNYALYASQEKAAGRTPVGFDSWLTEDANRKAKASAIVAGTNMTTQQISQFDRLVNNYNKSPLIMALDRTVTLKDSINRVRQNPSDGATQLGLVYSYVQALDTYQSAVREGELALVNSIDSKVGQLSNFVSQIQNGQIVRPEVANQIADAASNIVSAIERGAQAKSETFKAQAQVGGIGDAWNQYSGSTATANVSSNNNDSSTGWF